MSILEILQNSYVQVVLVPLLNWVRKQLLKKVKRNLKKMNI